MYPHVMCHNPDCKDALRKQPSCYLLLKGGEHSMHPQPVFVCTRCGKERPA